jgi:hypothetical protein
MGLPQPPQMTEILIASRERAPGVFPAAPAGESGYADGHRRREEGKEPRELRGRMSAAEALAAS